jgi:hypothetical protein
MELVSTKEEKKGEKNQTQIVGYKCIIPRAFSYPHRIVRYFLSRIQNSIVFHVLNIKSDRSPPNTWVHTQKHCYICFSILLDMGHNEWQISKFNEHHDYQPCCGLSTLI